MCYLLLIEGKYGLLNIHRQNIEGVGGSARYGVRGCGLAVLIAVPPLVSAHVVQKPGPPQLQEIRTGFCIK